MDLLDNSLKVALIAGFGAILLWVWRVIYNIYYEWKISKFDSIKRELKNNENVIQEQSLLDLLKRANSRDIKPSSTDPTDKKGQP